jgi:nucleotidyltransferase/DNA polymerase involved in DNA repair
VIAVACFDPFAVWLAEHERPERRGRPLASVQRGRVTGVSPAARRAGVQRGMTLAGARQQAPELEVVEAGGPHLEAAWEALVVDASGVSARFETLRAGLLAFEGERSDARQFAAAYRARVGVSTSVERAHLLAVSSFAGRAREGGGTSESALLARMPVHVLRGLDLSEKALSRLRWLGIERVGQLLAWRRSQLLAFLDAEGELTARALFGPYRTHLQRFTPPPRVSAAVDFTEPTREPAQLMPALAHLVDRAVCALGDRTASLATVKAEAAGVELKATRRAKAPSRDARRLLALAALALADTHAAPLGIDRLTLELGSLQRGGTQGSLWARRQALEKAIENVCERYPHALLRLVEVDPFAFATERRFELRLARSGALVAWEEVTRAPERLDGERAGASHERAASAASLA